MMKRRIVPLASLAAVAGIIALVFFLAGVFDGDDTTGAAVGGSESAAACTENRPDCEDTFVAPDGAGDGDEGTTIEPLCAPAFPDCVDTSVKDDEAGEQVEGREGATIAPVCAPGFPHCLDMVVVGANGDQLASCEEQAIKATLTDTEGLFGVDEYEIVVESAAFQECSNACLDAADDGEACAGVIMLGFVVVIELVATHYEYHPDLNGNVRLAL